MRSVLSISNSAASGDALKSRIVYNTVRSKSAFLRQKCGIVYNTVRFKVALFLKKNRIVYDTVRFASRREGSKKLLKSMVLNRK